MHIMTSTIGHQPMTKQIRRLLLRSHRMNARMENPPLKVRDLLTSINLTEVPKIVQTLVLLRSFLHGSDIEPTIIGAIALARGMGDAGNAFRFQPEGTPVSLVISGAALAFFALGLNRYVSLDALRAHRAGLDAFVTAHVILAGGLFTLAYAVATALSIPGALFLTVAGGLLFGTLPGTALTLFCKADAEPVTWYLAGSRCLSMSKGLAHDHHSMNPEAKNVKPSFHERQRKELVRFLSTLHSKDREGK